MKNPFSRRKKALNTPYFTEKWKDLQHNCANRNTWPQAIIEADKLLEEALKKSRFKGKTMGERLVSAQRELSSNETVWIGHKLKGKMQQDDIDIRKLKKRDMLTALSGFRQALRDLGALEKKND